MMYIAGVWLADDEPEPMPACPFCGETLVLSEYAPAFALACERCEHDFRDMADIEHHHRNAETLDEHMTRRP